MRTHVLGGQLGLQHDRHPGALESREQCREGQIAGPIAKRGSSNRHLCALALTKSRQRDRQRPELAYVDTGRAQTNT